MRVKSRYMMPPAAQTSTPDKVLRALEATVRRQKGAEAAYKAQLAEARRRIQELQKAPSAAHYSDAIRQRDEAVAALKVTFDHCVRIRCSMPDCIAMLMKLQKNMADLSDTSPDAALRLIALAVDQNLVAIYKCICSIGDSINGSMETIGDVLHARRDGAKNA